MALTYIQKTVHPTPITLHESNGVAYFTFPLLEQTRMVRHAFSTRLGGGEQGVFQYDELFADARRQPGRCA